MARRIQRTPGGRKLFYIALPHAVAVLWNGVHNLVVEVVWSRVPDFIIPVPELQSDDMLFHCFIDGFGRFTMKEMR